MYVYSVIHFIYKTLMTSFTVYGRSVKGLIEHPLEEMAIHPGKNTVTYESRLLKALLLQIQQM